MFPDKIRGTGVSNMLSLAAACMLCVLLSSGVLCADEESRPLNIERRSTSTELSDVLERLKEHELISNLARMSRKSQLNSMIQHILDRDTLTSEKRSYPRDMRRSFFNPLGFAPASMRRPEQSAQQSSGQTATKLFRYGK